MPNRRSGTTIPRRTSPGCGMSKRGLQRRTGPRRSLKDSENHRGGYAPGRAGVSAAVGLRIPRKRLAKTRIYPQIQGYSKINGLCAKTAARSWGQVRVGVGCTPPFPCQTVDLIGAGFWVRRGHQIRIPRKATAARATCVSGATSMATKAKTVAVKDKEKESKAAETPEKDSADAPSPLLDLSDAAVKKMIKQAKKRGFVTFDQLNEVLPSDQTSPEQIEDIMSMLSDMGINVTDADDSEGEEDKDEGGEDETDNELVEVTQKAVTEVKKSEPGERTADPVRMYLREMGF